MIALLRIVLLAAPMLFVACSEPETPRSAPSPPSPPSRPAARETPPSNTGETGAPAQAPATDPAALAQRGRAVYIANCIACHNPEPSIDGAIGPAIAGSSLQLLEARVMRNEYPEDYKPKRETKAMIALPYLEGELAALAAFLAG